MEIRYITPFSTERNKLGYPNIGGQYNKCIAELPDDCYIVLRDGDTMFLTNDWGEHIKAIIEENKDFDLITCTTNRVGLKHHCCGEHFYNSPDITEHIMHAHKLKESFGNNVYSGSKNYPITVAPGYFMLFHKSLWTKVGGFPEFDITFDRVFSDKVLKSGGKIGIATGLYIFHNYRMLSENPQSDIKHLRKSDKKCSIRNLGT